MSQQSTERSVEDIESWREAERGLLMSTSVRLRGDLEALLTNAAGSYGFRDEGVQNVRVKMADRIQDKLRRSAEAKGQVGILGFPSGVPDLIGARVLVRTLDDGDAVRDALMNNVVGDFDLKMDRKETKTGYRAVHFDGAVKMSRYPGEVIVPFEIQVQTLAQHAFDRHTHDSAYVRDAANSDERFGVVRGMQQTLAEHLRVADRLMCEIDRLIDQVLIEVQRHPVGDRVSFETVLSTVRVAFPDQAIGAAAAQRLAEYAEGLGVVGLGRLSEIVNEASSRQVELADRLRVRLGREPGSEHLVSEVLRELHTPGVGEEA
jgi:ppGpp synthetase/RelA/SpoT-type nucleotidyltranferase